jgi:hypothetical protein
VTAGVLLRNLHGRGDGWLPGDDHFEEEPRSSGELKVRWKYVAIGVFVLRLLREVFGPPPQMAWVAFGFAVLVLPVASLRHVPKPFHRRLNWLLVCCPLWTSWFFRELAPPTGWRLVFSFALSVLFGVSCGRISEVGRRRRQREMADLFFLRHSDGGPRVH